MKETEPSRPAQRPASYWKSLEELAEAPGFQDRLQREFPSFAAEWAKGVDRRRFLELSSASLALAGLAGCTRQPIEQIVPYVRQPEEVVPGRPLYFATTRTVAGYSTGVLAESHLGRPTKLEGHPEHPASAGKTDIRTQAAILELYDPDRSQAEMHLGAIRNFGAFVDELTKKMIALQALEGEGLRILTGSVTSPTLHGLLTEVLTELPKARWHQHEAASRDNARRGARRAFGRAAEVRWDLARADVVLTLDADLLTDGPGAVRAARDFARRRRAFDPDAVRQDGMNRLYAVEAMVTPTGSVADHRLALKPTEIAQFALALAARLGVEGSAAPAGLSDAVVAFVEAVAADLETHHGAGLIVAGDGVDAEVQVLVHAMNDLLGNLGTTVLVTEPVEPASVDQAASFAELVRDMAAGEVDTLLILGCNPVYDAPADLDVTGALQRVGLRIQLSLYQDETTPYCHWHVNQAHELESWGDGRAWDGTVSICQPLIEPLYTGKTAPEIVQVLLGRQLRPEEIVRQQWRRDFEAGRYAKLTQESDFERFWRRTLHDGLVPGSALPPLDVTVDPTAVSTAAAAVGGWSVGELELAFRPDPHLFDGRFANNGWLQECPRPITRLSWDNALLMSPKTARERGLGDLVAGNDQWKDAPRVELTVGERHLELPVWVVPGHADGALTLHLGYGRTLAGRVAEGAGFNAYTVRTQETPWRVAEGVSVRPIDGPYPLASTQDHHSMEGRELVRQGTFAGYTSDPHSMEPHYHVDPNASLMSGEDFPYDSYRWGMTLDLGACTGCNACMVACQAENNIPVVGKDQVILGREMHWIRVDRYYQGVDADHVDGIVHQPVTCMHCEQAPCEVVCPVAATVHSDEGLNDMIYNRCVGTRYCSNNCPYKVRRFNFLLYQDFETPQLQLGRNPDVSVRSRGVMEKCSYCVQRINAARIEAKREDRKIRDGEIVTACQQACPSEAIVFGDLADAGSEVSQRQRSPLSYSLLAELGTRPRTQYLARIRNPNPALEPQVAPTSSGH